MESLKTHDVHVKISGMHLKVPGALSVSGVHVKLLDSGVHVKPSGAPQK